MSMEEKIMHAAFDIFSREGYDSTTTRKIAQAADVNEVTIFRKFGCKGELAKAVIERHKTYTLGYVTDLIGAAESAGLEAGLDVICNGMMKYFTARGNFIISMVFGGWNNDAVSPHIMAVPGELIRMLSGYMERQIRAGKMRRIDTAVASMQMISFLIMLHFSSQTFLPLRPEESSKKIRAYLDIILSGAAMGQGV